MAQLLRRSRALGARGQAAYFASRERTRSLRDPSRDLHVTHRLGVSASDIDTDGIFGARTQLVTFATTVEITGESASGIICEFGGTTSGVKLAIDGGELYAAAGNVDEAESDGIDASVEIAALAVTGARLRLVFAINPGAGLARVWANGSLVARVGQASPEVFLDGVWSDDNLGSVGAAHSGSASINRNLGSPINGAPSDFALVAPFLVFSGQVPRQFDR